MSKRIVAVIMGILMSIFSVYPVFAEDMPKEPVKDYKVAFYAYDCYHIQEENGKKSGYGYEMMQGVSKYLQCTFSYVGYDKSATECVEMLRNGELDIYTAAKRTPEREEEFAFSTHPAITSYTRMNVKVGNNTIVAGDYSTYDGIKVGLLKRHTYNNTFIEFAAEKGFDCEIIYYDTPIQLSNALIDGEVDAVVNSYIRIPEDERTIESFGETPYYIMARKEDKELIDQIDYAIDCMNEEKPNWRTELYNKYYGSIALNTELTADELELLKELRENDVVIKGVMNPDANPYSWYEDGEPEGIAAEIFIETVRRLGLRYEFIPVSTAEEYEAVLESGDADVWLDMSGYYEDEGEYKYKLTEPYLTTTMSVLRARGASEKIERLAVERDDIALMEIISSVWPSAQIVIVNTTDECKRSVLDGSVDGALMMFYTAQKVAKDDIQNRLRSDIVPEAELELKMGINSADDRHFYGLWEKTLAAVSASIGPELVQSYIETTATPTMIEYMFDHPLYMVAVLVLISISLILILLYTLSVQSKKRQQKVSAELAAALSEAEKANESRQNFFSKMSHDIRTPLNVVLGMTQVARKYKDDTKKLDNALDNITMEGNYLLMLINSILDVNQLEHGMVDLANEPFRLVECVREPAQMLEPLALQKEQQLTIDCDCADRIVMGDANRFKQIVTNILSNAIKYTNQGGHIRLRLDYAGDNIYRFSCADDGIGMTEEFIGHICDDYVRAEDSRVSKVQGTGLGMSVVKGFTELMGGKLSIESRLGQGSVFTVELPFAEADEEQKKKALEVTEYEADESEPYRGRKVLLVEDNPLNAEIALELLHSIDMQADWAENGEVGVKRFEDSDVGEYFAVFMDIQMPVMDGVEAARLIRASDRADKDIPVYAMTANTFASDRKRCRDAGMSGYIPKPISLKDIADALRGEVKQL